MSISAFRDMRRSRDYRFRTELDCKSAIVGSMHGPPAFFDEGQNDEGQLRIICFGAHPGDAARRVAVPFFCPDVPLLKKNPVGGLHWESACDFSIVRLSEPCRLGRTICSELFV